MSVDLIRRATVVMVVTCAATLPGVSTHGELAGSNAVTAARAFVQESIVSTNVFVMNPPAQLGLYEDLTFEERNERLRQATRNGAVLRLYADGLPAAFQSRKEFTEHGPWKTWYPNGQIQSDEIYTESKLTEGRYFSPTGDTLGQITNGTGTKYFFTPARDGAPSRVGAITEYRDGAKHGRETLYHDYERRLTSQVSHYADGKLHGQRAAWNPDGSRHYVKHYQHGVQHGEEIYWHPNGQIRMRRLLNHGQTEGPVTIYYDTGAKCEVLNDNIHTRWYPTGEVMFRKTFSSGKLIHAESFDRSGRKNGEVKDARGAIVQANEVASATHRDRFVLQIFDGNPNPFIIPLPEFTSDPILTSNQISGTIKMTVPAGFRPDSVAMELFPPAQAADTNAVVTATKTRPADGGIHNVAVYSFPLRQPCRTNDCDLVVAVSVIISNHTAAYRAIVSTNAPPPVMASPAPIQYKLDHTIPAILSSADNGQTWSNVRSNFTFHPLGITATTPQRMIVWGCRESNAPETGIPPVAEMSTDGGRSWNILRVPNLDYLITVADAGDLFMFVGVRLPKDKSSATGDWFTWPRTILISRDGKFFTDLLGPGPETGRVEKQSVAPDKRSRAYLVNFTVAEPIFAAYWTPSPGLVPRPVLMSGQSGEIVWSADSRVLALQANGQFHAFADLRSGASEQCPPPTCPPSFQSKVARLLSDSPP
jgi:antitoxin component YwqK of YwqJK toxin-antitoxin module